jgi:hypothetical protein
MDDDGHLLPLHKIKIQNTGTLHPGTVYIVSSTRKFSHGMSLVHTGTVQLHQEIFLWNEFLYPGMLQLHL